jgi:putative cell wall-binding protein
MVFLRILRWILEEKPLLSSISREEIPKPAYNYAKKISELTGVPLQQVIRSQPFRKLLEKWSEKVEV